MTAPVPAETDPQAAPAEAPPADPPKPPDPPEGDKPLGPGGERALQAERQKAKDLEKELARYRKLAEDTENAKLSDIEKANKAAETEKTRADQLAAQLTRYKVIAETQLPAELHEFLAEGVTDEEALTEKANKLKAALGATPGKPAAPKPDPSQGARGEPAPGRPKSLGEAVGQHYQAR